ncbi:unnamed protein product [Linum trigynum]|uniref:Uncharacterized protein n=1 Tax=Linum trigynum TaxID=586398 RepID=A0AAV2GQ52_9ROSI
MGTKQTIQLKKNKHTNDSFQDPHTHGANKKNPKHKHTQRSDEYSLLVAEVVQVNVVHESIVTGWRRWEWGILPGSPLDWVLARYLLEQVLLNLLHTTSPTTLPLNVSKGYPLPGLHAVEALIICSHPGAILGLGSQVLLLELEMMVEELLVLEIQLLELMSEVVLGWKCGATTPILIGGVVWGGVGGSSVSIIGMVILSGSILRNCGLIHRRERWWRKPLNPLDAAHDSQQVHLRDHLFSGNRSVSLLCAILIGDLEIGCQAGDEWGAVEGRFKKARLAAHLGSIRR